MSASRTRADGLKLVGEEVLPKKLRFTLPLNFNVMTQLTARFCTDAAAGKDGLQYHTRDALVLDLYRTGIALVSHS